METHFDINRSSRETIGRDASVVMENLKRGDLNVDGKDAPRTIAPRL